MREGQWAQPRAGGREALSSNFVSGHFPGPISIRERSSWTRLSGMTYIFLNTFAPASFELVSVLAWIKTFPRVYFLVRSLFPEVMASGIKRLQMKRMHTILCWPQSRRFLERLRGSLKPGSGKMQGEGTQLALEMGDPKSLLHCCGVSLGHDSTAPARGFYNFEDLCLLQLG